MVILVKDWSIFWGYKKKYGELSTGIKATIWYTVANFIQKGFSFISIPILTRILSVSDYGMLMLYQSWFVLFAIFSTLNLSQAAFSRGLVEYESDRPSFTFSLMFLAKFTTVILAVIYFSLYFMGINFTDLDWKLSIFLFSDIFFNIGLDFYLARQRFEYEYKRAVFITLVSSLFMIIVSTLSLLLIKNSLIVKVFLDNFIRVIFGCYCIYLLISSDQIKFYIKKEYLKFGLSFTIPLIPHFLSHYALNQSDRLMINWFNGIEKVSLYSIAYSVSMIMFLVTNAINQSFMPYTFQSLHREDYRSIRKNTEWLFIVVATMVFLSVLFAPELVFILGGSQYKEAIWLIPPIAISVFYLFLYSTFSNISFYYKNNKLVSLVSFIAAISNIVLNYIFIPLNGYVAAAYTTLLCYVILALSHYMLYRNLMRVKGITEEVFNKKLIIKLSVALLLLIFPIVSVYSSFLVRYTLILIVLIFLIFNWGKLLILYKERKTD